jgi:hypothetical protein
VLFKPDKTADFEAVLGQVKESLGRVKARARNRRRMVTRRTLGPNGNTIYVMLITRVAKARIRHAEVFPSGPSDRA